MTFVCSLLTDDLGQIHQPADLLRRTPQTEVFRDVEHLRAEKTLSKPAAASMLGVRDTPTGPEESIGASHRLAKHRAPLHEV
jgi:hypothetical protein